MMLSMKRIVQAGLISIVLGGANVVVAQGVDPLAPAPTPESKAVDASGPSQLIESSANTLLKGIDARRDEFRKDPTGLYELVGKTLLPHFDTPYAAQLVLGKHWRTATVDQRKRFVEAFYQSLLYTYGDAMIDFSADRLKVFPTNVAPTDERATVRSEIKRSNGTKVPVNYSLRKVNGEWKAWDVVIEGISYVKSYREDYGAQVDQQGMDAVIKQLESRAQNAKAGKVKKT